MRLTFLTLLIVQAFLAVAQGDRSFLDGKYTTFTANIGGRDIQFYDFARTDGTIKAKYFANDAYDQYKAWKQLVKPNILLTTVGAYSTSFNNTGIPIGLTVDNGVVVNENLVMDEFDALVVVYNGGSQEGGIGIVNLERSPFQVRQGISADLWVRRSMSDREKAIDWAHNYGATLFQTHLLYDKTGICFPSDQRNSGSQTERRYLAITMKDGVAHHVIADMPNSTNFNRGGEEVGDVLRGKGYQVFGVINLDVGGYNLLQVYDDQGDLLHKTNHPISSTTNLIVWYY